MAYDGNVLEQQFFNWTEEIPDLHMDCYLSERITHKTVENLHVATPERCAENMNSMNLQLNFSNVN